MIKGDTFSEESLETSDLVGKFVLSGCCKERNFSDIAE
jgi:hypothetical protein